MAEALPMNEKKKNILTLAITLGVLLILTELLLRFVVIGPPLQETPNSMHIEVEGPRKWALKPNEEGVQAGAPYKINSQGFRDHEYTREKPLGAYRIAAIGDSVTFGKGVILEDTFSKMLERRLSSICGKKAEVLNFGVYGYNTDQEFAILKEQAMAYNPDMVIVLYTLNDPDIEFQFSVVNAEEKQSTLTSFKKFLTDHVYLYKMVARMYYAQSQIKKNKNLSVLTFYPKLHNTTYPGWKMVEERFSDMGALSEKEGISLVVFVFPELYRLNEEYPFSSIHQQVVSAARGAGLLAYDLFPYFNGSNHRDLRVHNFEDRHPNKRGHEIIANGMIDKLTTDVLVKECGKMQGEGNEAQKNIIG